MHMRSACSRLVYVYCVLTWYVYVQVPIRRVRYHMCSGPRIIADYQTSYVRRMKALSKLKLKQAEEAAEA